MAKKKCKHTFPCVCGKPLHQKGILDIFGEFSGVAAAVTKGVVFGLPPSPAEKASRKKRRK